MPLGQPPSPDLIARFAAIVGEANAITQAEAMRPYLTERRERYPGRSPLVLRPGSTAEVADIVRLANETRTAIVPQGGNTGLVGGQVPDASGTEVVVSLARLNRIRSVDAAGDAMIAEAGATLAEVREAAARGDRLFPLSLAAEAWAEIGGNVSTNAGGLAVLAYGTMRELVLGLEVVLASGEVWDGLKTLRKDNTGYDLKQLFIGAEGTLGIVTAAALKLFPRPRGRAVGFAGVENPEAALRLLNLAKEIAGNGLTSFELMPGIGIEFVLRHAPGTTSPLDTPSPWYVLLEVSSGISTRDAAEAVGKIAAAATGATAPVPMSSDRRRKPIGLVSAFMSSADVRSDTGGRRSTVPMSPAAIWRLREALPDVQKFEGGSIKHDVSVPVAAVPAFIAAATERVTALIPGARPVPFGHLGDGNIHFNITQPVGADKAAFLARWEEVAAVVHDVALSFGGSISAEHGIGQMKRDLLPKVKSPLEMDLMRRLKDALDPNGILNPGKLLARKDPATFR